MAQWKCFFQMTLLGLVMGSGVSAQTGAMNITFRPRFDGAPLVPGNELYHTPSGDSLYLDVLRFYVSHVQLEGEKGFEDNHCRLMDAEGGDSTLTVVLKNIPAGNYGSLKFMVGTDSLSNVSGAMEGDLDPTLGMYWAWNSGYINVKMEGRSKSCKTLHQAFTFHIGGYLPPYQTIRKVALPLNGINVKAGETTTVLVNVDLMRFFTTIQLAQTNTLMKPSKQAAALADVFSGIFSFAR